MFSIVQARFVQKKFQLMSIYEINVCMPVSKFHPREAGARQQCYICELILAVHYPAF